MIDTVINSAQGGIESYLFSSPKSYLFVQFLCDNIITKDDD